jgi:diguanylate cyclase (GGDEF)-like protein
LLFRNAEQRSSNLGTQLPDATSVEVKQLQEEVRTLTSRVRQLTKLAYEDSLVELPNRRSFLSQLDRVIALVQRYAVTASMIFVDVDGLKRINDRFGHRAGDDVLIEIAKLLSREVRTSDLVARLAGDEFGILLPCTNELSAWHLAVRVVEAVADSEMILSNTRQKLSVAVGVAEVTPDDTPQSVIERADAAMYQIKRT